MAFNNEPAVITCCKDCTDRYPGCHAKCEKYISQRAEYDRIKAEHKKKAMISNGLYEEKCNTIHRTTKWGVYRGKYRKGH